MNIDIRSILAHQQQLQLHKHSSQSSQQNDQQLLAQLLVAMILQQLEGALKGGGNNGNGNHAAGGAGGAGNAGGSSGVGGAGGAQQADGAQGGQGIEGILTQFMDLLKLLEKLFGDPADKGANGMAQKLAEALGRPGPGDQGGGGGPTAPAGPSGGGGPTAPAGPSGTGGASGGGSAGDTGSTGSTGGTGGSTGTSGTSGPTSIGEPSGETVVNETIVVKAGEVFDGKNMHFKAGPALGDGGASEGQKPVFILEDGATLKNLQISGADGVHVYGDATVQDVWWKDVGEDALTKKAAGDVRVIGGGANDAHDKVFIATAGGSLSIEGFTANNFGRLVATDHRFVPPRDDGSFPLEVSISNSKLSNGDEVFRTDAANARVTFKDVQLDNVNYDARGPSGMEVIGGQKVGRVEGHVI
jgi:hypothetical protein